MTTSIQAAAFAEDFAPVPPEVTLALLQRTGFSAEAYRDAYGDLAPLNWNPTQALAHFLRHGLDERRVAPLTLDRQALVALARLKPRDTVLKAKLLTCLGSHLFDHVAHPYGPAIAERWPAIRALVEEDACPYFVAGDSHSGQYSLSGTRGAQWLLPIHLQCTAASARGLANPASRSGYGALLRQAVQVIDTLPGADALPLLLQFGQVDIEFVYHFRRVMNGQLALDLDDYRAFCDTTIDRYVGFLTDLFHGRNNLRVFIVAVFPPALSDAAWRDGYVNEDIAQREETVPIADLSAGIRRLEIATLRQRSRIHLDFNNRLRMECRRLGFRFLDGCTPLLGPDGVVDARYVIPETGGAEHHLDSRATYGVLSALLWHCIDAMAPHRAAQ